MAKWTVRSPHPRRDLRPLTADDAPALRRFEAALKRPPVRLAALVLADVVRRIAERLEDEGRRGRGEL